MSGPFEALRVIDLSSGQVGGLATMVLADFGADVIKVEPPGGDPRRDEPAAPMWLRGKRSVELDLETPEDRERLHGLVRGADVVLASFVPGDAEAAGADYATLAALNPGLVYCSVTGWGPSGPYARYPADERLVAAKSGRMQTFAGVVRREGPAFEAVRVGTHAATQSALAGILGALLARERLGSGQLVETSLLHGMLPYDFRTLLSAQLTPRYPELLGDDPYARFGPDTQPMLGYQPVMAQDGRWIQFANLLEHLVHSSLVAMDLASDVLGDPRYSGAPNALTDEAREEVRNMILERVRERPAEEWMERFRENGNVAAEIVGTAQDALRHADMEANHEVVDVEHPRLGTVRQLGLLARLTETPGEVGAPGPEPGAHTAEVLAEPPRQPWTPPATNGSPPAHPLEGVTVLEFATIIAAPLGASLLGDMGARVIKVEPVDGGDPMRGLGVGLGAKFGAAKTTASKESICIDLKSEQGQAIVSRLIAGADVIIHNYRPGVPDRLGIGYEQARALKPDIVWLSLNGYGPDGPGARRPSAHPIPGAALGGALMQSGEGWPPAKVESIEALREASRQFSRANEGNPDPNTSVCVASSVMLGLMARQQTGKGQRIFLSMLGANGYANAEDFLAYEGKPERPTVDAQLCGTGALSRLYRSADGWVFLAAEDDASWSALCAATGASGFAGDARFATAAARREHDAALSAELEVLFATRDADDWERLLIAAGVGCVRADAYANPGEFLLKDPHAQANNLLADAQHALWGPYQRWAPPSRFSATPGRPRAGVLAGEHTDALLAEFGYGPSEVERLRAENVVWSEQPMELPEPATVG
jgi:crotonobetainyl-CoA:carnitine CoA-transferase CaiB-like acyl-CoA transferase